MATESPVRMVESGATNWPTSQIHNNMAADEIEGLLNNTHRYQILNQRNMAPNRSGSAPPSIEGSFAAIYSNLIAQKSFNSKLILENPVSEEQMRADPAYFAYYYSNVNLNPRLPPPLVASRDNKGNIGNNMRLTSYEEEAEDEKSDSCSDSGNLLKSEYDICNRSLVDLIQEDFPRTPSPLFSRSSSYHATTTTSDDLQPNISLENLFLSASNSSSNSNFSYANTNDKETKNEGAKPYSSKRIPSFLPNIPDTNSQYSQQKYPNKNNPPHQEQQQQCTIFSQPGVSAYYINPHGAQNHQQIPENVSPLQSPLPATAYNMNFSGNHYLPFYYPGTSHLFSSEYGGYNFNSAFIPPPFVAGYPHATSRIHMQYAAAATSSISGGEYLLHQQNINNFYSDGGGYYQSPSPAPPPIIQFQVSPLGSPLLPSSPVAGLGKRNDFNRNKGGIYGLDSLNNDLRRKYSILDELKSVGARNIQLSDIAGRIAEFSVDQHGSRFIQQKLENCGVEERESVFREVIPHASKLMTDVFGNYVIQKFFEHGSRAQRKQLADQISGKVLPLTLQMYGCRVIQKALEVIELDQKSELIHELDGNVLRCVRDQNGNHVIQKCIESIPTKNIGFIISSFQGQVATLSTHPYGCRVIQRVLEHCGDELQIQCIIDEILESAQTLAHDQHGNYVIQHVLERGKPHERSQIISKLSGKIVEMSQHKYASNVVEKCLEHGDVTERKALIQEIIGQSEDNNNLLPMMKDQFANYVVQKILEISNDKQREVLLDRININLQALKKYTYGKHIVARFEQLCGEEAEESSS